MNVVSIYLVNESEGKFNDQEVSENSVNYNTSSLRSGAPLRVLQTKVFNDPQPILQPQKPKIEIVRKIRPASAPKRPTTPNKPRKTFGISSKISTMTKKKIKLSPSNKKKKTCTRVASVKDFQVLDITNIPNWKYEVNKLIRTVLRHSVLCSDLQEEAARIGGLKLLDEYRRHRSNK